MNHKKVITTLITSMLFISSSGGLVAAASTPANSGKPATNNSATTKKQQTTTTNKVVHTLAKVPAVKVTARSTVKLTDVNILSQDDGNTVTYTLTYKNNDSTPMMMLDYWSKVKTKGGTSFSPKLIAKDQEKKTVSPGSTVDLTYVMKVGREVKLSDLNFLIVKWDFSKPNYESTLGKFNVPASYSITTPVGKTKTVRLSDSAVKVKVSGIKVYPGENKKQYVKVGVNLNNISYKLLDNPNIKWILRTPGGSNYPLTPDKDSTGVSIQAQANKTLNLMASLPTALKLEKSELLLVEEQGEEKTALPVAALQLPEASQTNVNVAANQPNIISIDGQPVSTLLESARVRGEDEEFDLTMQWVLKNQGKKEVKVPKYALEIRTEDGTSYPIETKALDDLKLKPGATKTIKLNSTIQGNGDTSKIKLYAMTPTTKDESKEGETSGGGTSGFEFSYPVGIYAIPESVTSGDGLTTETVIKNSKGTFGVSVGSLQRLPWTDSDIIAAKVTIRNASAKTVQLPELEAMFTIDSARIDGDTKLIRAEGGKLLGSGMVTEAYLLTKIPSELNMSRLELTLQEKVSEEEKNDWITLSTSGLIQPLSYVGEGKTYTQGTADKETELGIRRTYVYPGSSSDIVYTEFEMTNKSLRQSGLAKLVGYYKTADGQYYKATAKQANRVPGPGQKSIVTFWAKVPKSVKTLSDMRLIVGEGVADNKFVTGEGDATAYVNAMSFEVQPKSLSVLSSLNDIDLYPFKFSGSNIKAYLTGGTAVQIEMIYSLTQEEAVDSGEYGHKLILSITDGSGKVFDKELTPGTDLKTGINQTLNWSIDDTVFDKIRGGSYRVALYDVFEGQRIRLAEQGYSYDVSKLPKEEPIIPEFPEEGSNNPNNNR
ncbi:hypothetical protein C161_00605 [Paenibacillus sp. FSL R5-192]|uniref:hypothetical protein n=1 Tax=Paenibacillus sp. FSL R5-192 TaxID=1226754 RepID=UPI0003E1D082|nr:hypothetical protein [Paenibacillus sp. FSL R5-192]ETT41112.1 hypothetical protein C161_00605 [Paenibacillus sp. FSL R5-192]